MGAMEDEESYLCLSRKALQELCKKNGLSARKTNSELAKSLAFYYQGKNGSKSISEERSSGAGEGLPHLSPVSESQSQLNPVGETQKGVHESREEAVNMNSCGHSSSTKEVSASAVSVVPRDSSVNAVPEGSEHVNYDIEETRDCLLGSKCDDSGYDSKKKDCLLSTLAGDSDQDLVRLVTNAGQGNASHIHCETRDIDAVPTNRSFISSNGINRKVDPTHFNFYARSDEGINICVDFDSKPTEWVDSFKNIRIQPDVLGNKPWVLHHELRNLGKGNEQPRSESATNCFKSTSSSIVRESVDIGVDHPDGTERSSRFSTVVPSISQVEILGNAEPNSEILNANMPQTGCADSPEHQPKSGSACPDNPETVSVRTSSGALGGGFHQSNGALLGIPPVADVLGNGSTCPGSLVSDCIITMQASGVGHLPDLNNPVIEDEDRTLDENTEVEPLVECPQEQQTSGVRSGPQSSECCQFDISSTKTSKRPHTSESDGLQNKRQRSHSEDRNIPTMWNLRSRTNQATGASPRPRRSKRLIPKV